MVSSVLNILFWIVFAYCALSVAYLVVLAFFGKFFYRKKYDVDNAFPQKRIAVLVPAYKEDGIILSTANSLLRLNYPKELYDVYIIADSFQHQTLEKLGALPLHLMEVSFDKSTKTKSLNQAFSQITKQYDIALICDA